MNDNKIVFLISQNTEKKIALIGNPNTGKSTVFNALTGKKQHTGNWSGKTVDGAYGKMLHNNKSYTLIDLPGIYSLSADSDDEKTTSGALLDSRYDLYVLVLDASCIERNLILAQCILSLDKKTLICLNLIDEAEKKGIKIDIPVLSEMLGAQIIPTSAAKGYGINELRSAICTLADSEINAQITIPNETKTPKTIYTLNEIKKKCIRVSDKRNQTDRRIDNMVLSRPVGVFFMLLLLVLVFWLTITGANYPSALLSTFFSYIEHKLLDLFKYLMASETVIEIFVYGIYRTLSWVVAVMLPPMAIFFPLFALLEDSGLLPRFAFNLDKPFCKAGTSGKQALSMCMGLGCNAAGVTSCRIFASKKEKNIAILTNSFIPCNGRFPSIMFIATVFSLLYGTSRSATLFMAILAVVLTSVVITFLITRILSSVIKSGGSLFVLELPPYRKPMFINIIKTSFFDKTLKILMRAVIVTIPAGLVIWLTQNIYIDGFSLISYVIDFLNPIGKLMGLDGYILAAFLLGFPANEIVLPILIMLYSGFGHMSPPEVSSMSGVMSLFSENNWTACTCFCYMFLLLNHFPCATTVYTIIKETKKPLYGIYAVLIPTVVGIIGCVLINMLFNLF